MNKSKEEKWKLIKLGIRLIHHGALCICDRSIQGKSFLTVL